MDTILRNVLDALERVEVHGEQNLNLLLASIQTLRNLRGAARKEAPDDDGHDKQG